MYNFKIFKIFKNVTFWVMKDINLSDIYFIKYVMYQEEKNHGR